VRQQDTSIACEQDTSIMCRPVMTRHSAAGLTVLIGHSLNGRTNDHAD